MNLSDLRINIVYTPGTVSYLSCFSLSLVEWTSECRFRLVSNGCSQEEERTLRRVTDSDERLEFLSLDTDRVIDHGTALSLLERQESARTFAFLDSDIFATGDFLSDLSEDFASADAVFSFPLTWTFGEKSTVQQWEMWDTGMYSSIDQGVCLGSTLFALYDRDALGALGQKVDVGFRRCYWRQIPHRIRKELSQKRQVKAVYDTGQLVNILLSNRGCDLRFGKTSSLTHLGGMSASLQRRDSLSFISRLVRSFGGTLGRYLYYRVRSGRLVSFREVALSRERTRHRLARAEYLRYLLKAIRNGEEVQPSEDSGLWNHFLKSETDLRQLFQKHSQILDSSFAP